MPSKTDNMKLWNAVCTTKPTDTKKFKGKGGFQGTAICAQSQRRVATEQWGPFGTAWGVKDETYSTEKFGDDFHNWILVYRGTLYYPGGEFGICADIDLFTYSQKYQNWSRNNDPCKKARTDALTKGLSELGFNADVFLGKFDDNKYVQEQRQREQADNAPAPPPAQPPEPVAPAETVDAQVKRLITLFGGDLCGKAKLRLIKPDGSHFTAADKKLTKGQANELERILNAGGLE